MHVSNDEQSAYELAWSRPGQCIHRGVLLYRGYRLSLDLSRKRLELPSGTVDRNYSRGCWESGIADGRVRVRGSACAAAALAA
ncbi:hypothetical protein GCM10009800_53760 [Nocardiopsis rhodophaea]